MLPTFNNDNFDNLSPIGILLLLRKYNINVFSFTNFALHKKYVGT